MGIPIVTGYVLIGVILGASLLKIFHSDMLSKVEIINDMTLGIIGFTIGTELRKDVFQKMGRSIFWIATMEAFLAFILVSGTMAIIWPAKIYQAIILGAVASATAPAATVYVIQQYKAKGPLSSTILAVVGVDDAFALIIFVFAAVISKQMLRAEQVHFLQIVLRPLIEIGLSLALGFGLGWIFSKIFGKIRFPDELLLGLAMFLLFILGLAKLFHLSGLLASMVFGGVVSNINPILTHRSSTIVENVSPLLFAFFFIFAGAHLDITLIPQIGMLGLIYLLARTVGKIGGASLGALIGKASKTVRKYIGVALIPQVGVALALAIMVKQEFAVEAFGEKGRMMASIVINVLLFTTIFTEIVGPLLTKRALMKAGECNPEQQ